MLEQLSEECDHLSPVSGGGGAGVTLQQKWKVIGKVLGEQTYIASKLQNKVTNS